MMMDASTMTTSAAELHHHYAPSHVSCQTSHDGYQSCASHTASPQPVTTSCTQSSSNNSGVRHSSTTTNDRGTLLCVRDHHDTHIHIPHTVAMAMQQSTKAGLVHRVKMRLQGGTSSQCRYPYIYICVSPRVSQPCGRCVRYIYCHVMYQVNTILILNLKLHYVTIV